MKTIRTLKCRNVNYRLCAMTVALMVLVINAGAQTIPAAQSLPYFQDFSTMDGAYPPGWQGWVIHATASPSSAGRTVKPVKDSNFTASSNASIRTSGAHDYDGKLGLLPMSTLEPGLCLAINTTGCSNIQLSFDAMTIRNAYNGNDHTQLSGLVLQYRVATDNTGDFTLLDYTPEQYRTPAGPEQLEGTTGQNIVGGFKVILPAACENQEMVQLRWQFRRFSGTGDFPSIAVDNVRVEEITGEVKSDDARLSQLSVSTDNGSTYKPLTLFEDIKTDYTYYLTQEQALPLVGAVKNDDKANDPAIVQASATTNNKASITVTAEDGITEKVYEVTFIQTDYVFIDGVTGTSDGVLPADWGGHDNMFYSANLEQGNNKYEGNRYARCMTAGTTGYIILPPTKSVGMLSFYACRHTADVEGAIEVSTKTGDDEWVSLQTISDINSTTYREFTVDINQQSAEDILVRLYITKTIGTAGFRLDDFAYTAAGLPAITEVMTISSAQAALYEADALITVEQLTVTGASDNATLADLQAALGDNNVITNIVFADIEEEIDANYFAAINPNCLVYVPAETTVAASVTGITNLITGNTAAELTLTDGYSFYCPADFTATKAAYTRECFTDGGWETIMLPFAVTAIKENGVSLPANGYTIEEFSSVKNAETVYFTTIEPDEWTADTPYIISFTDRANAKETFTFEGGGEVKETVAGTAQFKGTYISLPGDDLYILNNTGTEFGEGEAGNSTIPEFRAYLTMGTDGNAHERFYVEHESNATNMGSESVIKRLYCSNGILYIYLDKIQEVKVYGIDGRIVYTGILSAGENTVTGLTNGIYLLNNQKVVIN